MTFRYKFDDGPIMVCDRNIQVCQVVHWNEHHQDFNWKTEEGTTYHKDAFTDWMPLPATPTPGGEK